MTSIIDLEKLGKRIEGAIPILSKVYNEAGCTGRLRCFDCNCKEKKSNKFCLFYRRWIELDAQWMNLKKRVDRGA